MQWNTLEDLCGSDHHPIVIQYGETDAAYANASWKLRKADWDSFSEQASNLLGADTPDKSMDELMDEIISIASRTIPKSKGTIRKRNAVWFDDTCKKSSQ